MLPQSSRWHGHRDMLHDRARNSAYDRAISAAVREISSSNRTAVDVGTGSGERERHLAAEATAPTGDQRNLAAQIEQLCGRLHLAILLSA